LGKNRVSRGWGKTGFREVGEKLRNPVGKKPGFEKLGKTGFLERYPQKPGWQKTGFREVGEKLRNPVGKKPGFERLGKNRVSRSWGKPGFLIS
jgi:hypothetical protein